ncbi:AbiH family protein [Chryseobacterium aquaticum]|uniref:AbiH family protein n=1 Tax=Chryseobacterium aquaticum TaxID=452084 RepID=UPI003F702150
MPKILITGNGFDLNFNLPTSYCDFIQILNYVEKNDVYDFDSIYSNSNNYIKIKSSFVNTLTFNKNEIDLLKSDIKDNLWFQFFKNELNIETWIDFENKINYVLRLLLNSINIFNDKFFNRSPLGLKLLIYDSTVLNNKIEIINVLSFFQIILKENDSSHSWSFLDKYLVKKYGYYTSIDIQKIVSFLNQQLNSFKDIFNKYFSLFIIPLYEKNIEKPDVSLIKSINYYFTFNYTPTFETLFKSTIKTNYLHGKINSDINSIVLGIDNIPDDTIDQIHYLPFTKYYQKLNNNTDYYFLDEIKNISKNSSMTNYEFYFWGHSLDHSDKDYINEIFDFVTDSMSKIKSIKVIYHNEESKSKLLLNLLDIRGKNDIVSKMRKKELVFLKAGSKDVKIALNKSIDIKIYSTPTIH